MNRFGTEKEHGRGSARGKEMGESEMGRRMREGGRDRGGGRTQGRGGRREGREGEIKEGGRT